MTISPTMAYAFNTLLNAWFYLFFFFCILTLCIGLTQLPSSIHDASNLTQPAAAAAKSHQSCPIPFDPIDGSPSGSPVTGILQARTLEWVAISFSNA